MLLHLKSSCFLFVFGPGVWLYHKVVVLDAVLFDEDALLHPVLLSAEPALQPQRVVQAHLQ